MRITNFRHVIDGQRARVCAELVWEDVQRKPFGLFVETDIAFQNVLQPDPNAFLVMAVLPAWQLGERRVHVAGGLCPVLRHDIRAAFRVLEAWYPELREPPVLDSACDAIRSPCSGQALSLLSCGVDSLATLRQNKLLVPDIHPGAIRAVVPVIEHRVPGEPGGEESGRLVPTSRIATDCGVEMMPVWTNAWFAFEDGYFSDQKAHGALFAGIASCFSAGYSRAYIAASFDGPFLAKPWGSSPLLDPFYSSAHFRIDHHGAGMSRFEKTALIADWPSGLNNLRVCQKDSGGTSNCGTCEKCIRVMTALEALGKLETGSAAFPVREISADLLGTLVDYNMITSRYQLAWYQEVAPALAKRGRGDLVLAINRVAEHFEMTPAGHR